MVRRNTISWKYEIGQNISDEYRNIKITDRYTKEYPYKKNGKQYIHVEKYYKYRCNVCGFNDGNVSEGNLANKHVGCSCCHNRIVVKGINDIGTTRPDLLKYFVDTKDAYIRSDGSGDRVLCKCPICGYEKYIIVSNLSKHGFVCDKYSDGISYPEKFMMSMLAQLNVAYITQYKINGFKYKYDFYLCDYKTIIEVNGEQHYTNTFVKTDIRDIKLNDLNKKKVAMQNGIENYIEIDCSKSDKDYIKMSIYNNDFLQKTFNLNDVNWDMCNKEALRNKLVDVCRYWKDNSEHTNTNMVAEMFNISYSTVIKYLHIGNNAGICEYNPKKEMKKAAKNRAGKNNHMARKVRQIGMDGVVLREWECIKDIEREFGYHAANITKCCRNKIKTAYGYMWEYIN